MRESWRRDVPIGVLLMALVCAGCDGPTIARGPAAPSQPQTASIALDPGAYTLTLAVNDSAPVPGSAFVCLGIGTAAPTSALVDVTVESTQSGWSVRAASGTLTMALQAGPGVVSGTLEGTARSRDGQVSVGASGLAGQTVTLTGIQTRADTLAGQVQGQVTFGSAAGSFGCNSSSWSLARQ